MGSAPTRCRIKSVPEISRFFGIVIRMFAEPGSPHHVPHFHAYYQDEVGIFGFDPVELIAGSLPKRQMRLVEAWGSCIKPSWLTIGRTCRRDTKPAAIE